MGESANKTCHVFLAINVSRWTKKLLEVVFQEIEGYKEQNS